VGKRQSAGWVSISIGIFAAFAIAGAGFLAYYYPRWDFGGYSSASSYCYYQYMDQHPNATELEVPRGYALWIPFTPWFICDVFPQG
jgi:hypothetical protein